MPPPASPAQRPGHTGFHFDELDEASAWIREEALLRLPPLPKGLQLRIRGSVIALPDLGAGERGLPSLVVGTSGGDLQRTSPKAEGDWELVLQVGTAEAASGAELRFILEGVGGTNALAWLARVSGLAALARFRAQRPNRRLRIRRVETLAGEPVCDFSLRGSTLAPSFMREAFRPGLNVVGWLDAELGLGEGARCMLRAAAAAGLPTAPVQLLLPCRAARGNTEFSPRPAGEAPHAVNVFHIDPPAAHEIDRRHGPALRQGRRNIGYWAWELGEFPDAWVRSFEAFDEIWCPSDFVREAVSQKSPVPVLTMPHAIEVPASLPDMRERLELPGGRFLFLFSYDLNSYSARKNPRAVIEAFEAAGFAPGEAGLVLKVHNAEAHKAELAALYTLVEALGDVQLVARTLGRQEQLALIASCDAFVSLHRSEGFGLAVAEAMALGKPVIATDWSATAEYLGASNGCPVRHRLVRLERNEGPYPRNSYWAEPDTAHAAEWMRRLVREPGLAASLGGAARDTIRTRFSPARIGGLYRRRLEAIAQFA